MKFEEIKKYFQENYKIFIPIGFMIILFIAFLIYYKVSISNNYKVDSDVEVFQYLGNDKKYTYDAIVSKNRKDVIVDFKPVDVKISLDSTPIYINDKNKNTVIFYKDMSVVMPTMSCAEYLAKGYSYITFEKNVYNMTTDRYHGKLNHYFLYDGKDLYFFIEKVTLKVNNDSVELSPYSYVIARYNNYISYYDKASDTYKTIDVGNSGITVENEFYKIVVDKDIIDYNGENVILASDFSNLITIDKKGKQ